MQYIKVSNEGVLDVVGACSMLGASVKTKEDSIGMFGTGLKYALAQAVRMGEKVCIASGDDVFETCTVEQEFRNTTFTKVHLKNIFTGDIYETPITTEFGNHDWTDPWSVYREIVCNAMDEEGCQVSLVNDIRRSRTRTSIYLSYETFGRFFDDSDQYFCKEKRDWVKRGTGIIYKSGVRVGKMDGFKLDMQFNNVTITESRDVSLWSANFYLGQTMRYCTNRDTWLAFVESEKSNEVDLSIYDEETTKLFRWAMKKHLGKFAVCPDVDHIKKDLEGSNVAPFVMPSNWNFASGILPSFTNFFKINKTDIRHPDPHERDMIKWGLEICKKYGMNCDADIRIYENQSATQGLAEAKGKNIWLKSSIFKSQHHFLMVFLEEVAHHDSGYEDYTREITEYFIEKIVNMETKGAVNNEL
jgi:hypothetical protein